MALVDPHHTLIRRRNEASTFEGVRNMPSIEIEPSPCLGYTKSMKFMPLLSGINYPGGVIHAFSVRVSYLTYLYILAIQTFDLPPEFRASSDMVTELFRSGRHVLRTVLCVEGHQLVQILTSKDDILEYVRYSMRCLREQKLDDTFIRSGTDEDGNLVKLFASDMNDNQLRVNMVVYDDHDRAIKNLGGIFERENLTQLFSDLLIRYDPLGTK